MATKDEFLLHAKMAEQVDRYDDMAQDMKRVAELAAGELSEEERNLLSLAYKNTVGTRRTAWRALLNAEEEAAAADGNDQLKKAGVAKQYREQVEAEIHQECNELLDLLENTLIPKTTTVEQKIFYTKMKGDYYRYRAEVASGEQKDEVVEKAGEAYQQALDMAEKSLEANHPLRLGLALNYSVFFYEIKSDTEQACKLAQKAFDDAIDCYDALPEQGADATLVLQLLQDNLGLWRGEEEEDEPEPTEEEETFEDADDDSQA